MTTKLDNPEHWCCLCGVVIDKGNYCEVCQAVLNSYLEEDKRYHDSET